MHYISILVNALKDRRWPLALIVFLTGKNASWSIVTGKYINDPAVASPLWWYALAGLALALASLEITKNWVAVAHLILSITGCITSSIISYEISSWEGPVVAPWYDFAQLSLVFFI